MKKRKKIVCAVCTALAAGIFVAGCQTGTSALDGSNTEILVSDGSGSDTEIPASDGSGSDTEIPASDESDTEILASDEIDTEAADGVYAREIAMDGNNLIFRLAFDQGTMTYVLDMEQDGRSYGIDSGTYAMDGGIVRTFSETDDRNSLSYLMDGEYILAKEYLFEGAVPDGDAFDATCTLQREEGWLFRITFHADGTYEEENPARNAFAGGAAVGDDASAENGEENQDSGNGGLSESNGTYVREGNWIRRNGESGDAADLYIYQGQVTNYYYVKE